MVPVEVDDRTFRRFFAAALDFAIQLLRREVRTQSTYMGFAGPLGIFLR